MIRETHFDCLCFVAHSYTAVFVTAEPLFRSPCELLPVGLGHPVQAMLKSFTALSGCASRGTTSLPQEVHIINLRGHAAEGPHNTLAEVSLTINEAKLDLYVLLPQITPQ